MAGHHEDCRPCSSAPRLYSPAGGRKGGNGGIEGREGNCNKNQFLSPLLLNSMAKQGYGIT